MASKPQRKRVHFSCYECHRRKQKCNRQQPCDQCVARRIPHLCRQFIDGVHDPYENDVDVKARLDKLTRTVEDLSHLLSSHLNQPIPSTSNEVIPEDQGRLDKGRFFGSSAMSSVSESTFNVPTFNNIVQTPPDPAGAESNIDKVKRLLSTSGITMSDLESVITNLPRKELQDGLLSVYFNEIDWRYPLFSPRFYLSYDSLHEALPSGIYNVTSPMIRFIPLLFITLAIATLTAPDDLVGDANSRKKLHESLYGSSRRSANLAGAMQDDDLDSVLCGLLTARYLILVRRASEGFVPLGAAIHTAQALGLHRDPAALKINDVLDQELRRKVWTYIYHQDRMSSLLLGRPLAINDADCDTKPPSNISDEALNAGKLTIEPMEVPTIMSYTILRHSLAKLMGHIQTAAFGIRPPPYHVILQLDQELIQFKESLPPCFQLDNPDLRHDPYLTYLSTHRYFLSTEFYFVRITLHRPYLILGKSQSTKYQPSRIAAIESAKADLVARKQYQARAVTRPNKLSAGSYRIMTSLMILGIALVLTPTGSEADELRKFLDEHTTGVDEATVRELAVLELFKRGATEVSNNANSKKRRYSEAAVDDTTTNSIRHEPTAEPVKTELDNDPAASLNPSFPLGAQNFPSIVPPPAAVPPQQRGQDTTVASSIPTAEYNRMTEGIHNINNTNNSSNNEMDLLGEHAQALLNQWLDVNSLTTTTPPGVGISEDNANDPEMDFWQNLVTTLSSN
ncbi:hypothetical protein E3Q22_04131 [Wallemia mellicola]|uniref:Zn(2)-C6 fungal-type domain-containing protein n=1 Tax=Wallemia mellicola TaxID=1708541 RepID=A0A4T0LX81_9BASI|nr:hypothetical protein E3Q22_04131 [Wallemia mellicola]